MTPRAQSRSIDDFFRSFTDEWVRMNPNLAIQARYFTGPEQNRLETQLTPLVRQWRQRRVALAERGLSQLRRFDSSRFTPAQRVSADLMKWQLELVVEERQHETLTFPLEQFAGANVTLVNALTVLHPLNSERDAKTYLARLGQVSTRMAEATAEARERVAKGLVPPRFIVRATLEQMKLFVETPPAQNPFASIFRERISAIGGISPERRDELAAEAVRITARQVYPAWSRAIALLEPLMATATDDAGLWRFEGGASAYAFHLKRFTTTALTPDAIHEIGLREAARIEKEMDGVLRTLGRSDGSVRERVARLEKDLAYPLTPEGRTHIMADVDAIMADARQRSETLFDRVPRAPVIARPYPAFRENAAAASYGPPSQDGSRPGTFQIPLRESRMTKFGLRTLVYHETVPGHHFQMALEVEDADLPRFRRMRALGVISALNEGWALYAEQLAAESGWYDGDPEGLLGQLDAAMFRARRLVVDTGLHAKKWTRQQAIDYGIEPSEVDRYVVNPGQACAYMIGQLKIVELREKARSALGGRFSPSIFHDAVLDAGTVPLPILERQVDAYIQAALN